jgi:sec-independent protein translocase protein TatA
VPFGLGIWEIVILVGILALLFGTKGVPQMARKLGGSVREVKDAVAEVDPRRMLDAPAETKAAAQPKARSAPPATPPAPAPPPASAQPTRPAGDPEP